MQTLTTPKINYTSTKLNLSTLIRLASTPCKALMVPHCYSPSPTHKEEAPSSREQDGAGVGGAQPCPSQLQKARAVSEPAYVLDLLRGCCGDFSVSTRHEE